MKNKIQKFKKSDEYIVLSEMFKPRIILQGLLLNLFAFASMYGALELWLIIKFG